MYGLTERERKAYGIKTLKEHERDAGRIAIAIFIGMLVLTAIYFAVPDVSTAKEMTVTIDQKTVMLGDFCTGAIRDHKTLNKPLTGDLLDVCGGYE